MIKVVHATAGKGVPVSMASGAVRAVLRSNVSQIHWIKTSNRIFLNILIKQLFRELFWLPHLRCCRPLAE